MTLNVTIESPAKINLGLEILGKRPDGLHEIRSILAMIDLHDTLQFHFDEGKTGCVEFSPASDVPDSGGDLVSKSIDAFNTAVGTVLHPSVSVTKRIPVAGGLGGASSNAATTLLVMNRVANGALGQRELANVAASLGSDIPFFLGSPAAMVRGRGTEMEPVRAPEGYVVIVSPLLQIANKTGTLYAALSAGDFSDGTRVLQQRFHLNGTGTVDPGNLSNAFDIALRRLRPELASLVEEIEGAAHVPFLLTGAGPSRYALAVDRVEAERIASAIRTCCQGTARVITARFRSDGIDIP